MGAMTVRRVQVAQGVELDVHEHGSPGDPVVVLLHGFPESSHSWRHQVGPIAAAGYHVLAPDQRGYARSSAPLDVAAYTGDLLVADVCALLDDVDAEQAVIVGHDWGALLAWHMGAIRPERCRAIVGASVPYNQWPAKPTDVFRFLYGDRFFYILYFQEPGVAEAEFDADPERFLRSIIWVAAGDSTGTLSSDLPMVGTTMQQSLDAALGARPEGLPPWLPQVDFDHFVDQFRASGFFGPVSWYRNFDVNYERTRDLGPERFTMPTAFIAGDRDPVIVDRMGLVDAMASKLPDFRGSTLIAGAGHWVQQEAPDEFNDALLSFLARC